MRAALAIALCLAGCELVLGIEDGTLKRTSSTGMGGGAGSTVTSAGGASGGNGGSTEGGGGTGGVADCDASWPQPLARWIADDISGSDWDPIDAWQDQAQTHELQQPAGGARPILATGAINGHDAAQFNAQAFMTVNIENAELADTGNPDITVFVVAADDEPATSTTLRTAWSFDGAAAKLLHLTRGMEPTASNAMNFVYSGPQSIVINGGALGAQPHVWTAIRDGVVMALRQDGMFQQNADGTSANVTTAGSNRVFRIGYDGMSSYWVGRIAEIVFYGRGLTPGEMDAVEDCLKETYAISP